MFFISWCFNKLTCPHLPVPKGESRARIRERITKRNRGELLKYATPNFEYQSEDSESDSTSTSSQEGEVYESCSKVEVEGRVKKSKRLSPFPETRVVQALFEYFIDFVFS
ncbi:hypothetical protein Y032_0131g1607 [Ancylostoma ceylanicum]|uniref:Uncharacterized protein n=1 Tax=Ancylostoma ceylanicum TaxID=53326 RepID=A0A016T6R2_9BILA|nr:hypothetical protein Y032_0131g1607 [Ancylostoma ceylanicum]